MLAGAFPASIFQRGMAQKAEWLPRAAQHAAVPRLVAVLRSQGSPRGPSFNGPLEVGFLSPSLSPMAALASCTRALMLSDTSFSPDAQNKTNARRKNMLVIGKSLCRLL